MYVSIKLTNTYHPALIESKQIRQIMALNALNVEMTKNKVPFILFKRYVAMFSEI